MKMKFAEKFKFFRKKPSSVVPTAAHVDTDPNIKASSPKPNTTSTLGLFKFYLSSPFTVTDRNDEKVIDTNDKPVMKSSLMSLSVDSLEQCASSPSKPRESFSFNVL